MSVFPGAMRLSRESVCTAAMPESCLSTYIPTSNGWSKPVWYLLATISTCSSGRANTLARSRPFSWGFSLASVTVGAVPPGRTLISGSGTSPENATRAWRSRFSLAQMRRKDRAYLTAAARESVTTIALARPPSSPCTAAR